MKIVKLLVTLSIINFVGVSMIVMYGTGPKQIQEVAVSSAPIPSVASSPNLVIVATPTPMPVATTRPQPVVTATPAPVPTVAATPVPTAKPSGCIVSIDGVSYDVTRLKVTHSGGDIFNCGTDMSSIFWREHNNRILQRMQQYKI